MMEQKTTENRRGKNLLLIGGAVLFVALSVVLLLVLRPNAGARDRFVIRYGNGQSLTVFANESRTVVIRNGAIAEEATGESGENVIRIEDGKAWMQTATCPRHECVRQGALSAETVGKRPLGTWIICAPHGVSVEYAGGAE
jgi:hypothetical protein